MILVDLERVGATRPQRPLFADLSLTVSSGDRLGVVGLNGTGKSTLLRVVAGVTEPETGSVRRGRGVRVGLLDQEPVLAPRTVRAAMGGPSGPAGWQAEAVLDRLGMAPFLDADVATLSGGQIKRVALARVLVDRADLLVLDEPTNHLDLDAIAWLEDHLAARTGGLVLVTHDRHVLDRVTTEVLELDRGSAYLHDGGYSVYLEGRAQREDQAAEAESTRRNLARRELAWLRRGAKARSRKPQARIARATALVEGSAQAAAREGTLDLSFAGTRRLGDQVIELEGVGAEIGGRTLFAGLDLLVGSRARLGLVGPNGSGKTTLLDIVAGRRPPTWGTVRLGSTVRLGYRDQMGAELDPAARVRDAVAGGQPPTWEHARLLERFWFDRDAQWAPVGTLSGGERRRLQLLLILAAAPNVLLLDEPTNDLDLDTLRALEDFLEDWPGALLTVSHDRSFLERTVEDVLALDGEGGVAPVVGGVEGYVAGRRATADRGRRPEGGRPERPRSGRSPSTLRRLLGQAERALADAQARRDGLVADLAGAGTDYARLAGLGEAVAKAGQDVAAAEDRWLELAAEAEE